MEFLLALLLYPGLALALVLAFLFGRLIQERRPVLRIHPGTLVNSIDGLAGTISILLAGAALACLPWPWHPAAGQSWVGNPILLWSALEGSFVAPLLPALLSPSALVGRAAIREAQISTAGRCIIWLTLGTALWYEAGWEPILLPGRALLAMAGLMVIPAVSGIGRFAAERSLNLAGAEEGLDERTTSLLRFARTVRSAVVLAILIIASLPMGAIRDWIALLLALALFLCVTVVLQRVGANQPRAALPALLRWCWWRALPVALLGLIYLQLI